MRSALLALALLGLSASAQPALDVSLGGGVVVTGSDGVIVPTVAGAGAAALTITPDLPRGLRLVVSATAGPGEPDSEYGQLAAVGVGMEAPLSGGRDGVYVALGGAWLDFDNYDPTGCHIDPDCLFEGGRVSPHRGLAWTGGVGARVPVGSLWVEPALSAMVWDDVLLGARLGMGWRLR